MTRPLSMAKRRLFLRHLADHGHVVAACKASGIARSTAYRTRQLDPEFAAAWDDAERQAADLLEAEAWRRGVDGVPEPVYYQGEEVGEITRYSDRMLDRLLRARRPERFRDHYTVDGEVGVSVQTLTREQLEIIAAGGRKK